MMIEIIILLALFIIGFIIGLGLFFYTQSNRATHLCAEDVNKPDNLLTFSQSKIIELPARKDKSHLFVFKNGKKQEFVIKK